MIGVEIRSWSPSEQLAHALQTPHATVEEHHYLYAEDRQRVVEHLQTNYEVIVVMALRGYASKVIGAGFGVSREAIDRRLRPLGFKNPPGVKGRPRSSPQASNRY